MDKKEAIDCLERLNPELRGEIHYSYPPELEAYDKLMAFLESLDDR